MPSVMASESDARLLARRDDRYVGPESVRPGCSPWALADTWADPGLVTDAERGVVQHATRGGKGCVARIRRGR